MKKSRAGKFQSINHSAKISQTVQKERLSILITKRFSNSSQKQQPRLNIKNTEEILNSHVRVKNRKQIFTCLLTVRGFVHN
jgi:hypothetical protein